MEGLNKQQLILLALFVSFVTSIATGVVTVALMNQAPSGIVQTINRVVERTIEKVVQEPSNNNATVITKETIVVSEDDKVVDAINKNSDSIIRIYKSIQGETGESKVFTAIGVIVSEDGLLITDGGMIASEAKYFAVTKEGSLFDLKIEFANTKDRVAVMRIVTKEKDKKFSKANIATSVDLKLGQSVIFIGGEQKNYISTGIISSISTQDIKTDIASTTASTTDTKTETVVSNIETNISYKDLISGGPLLNLSGEIIALKSVFLDSEKTNLFVPVSSINSALASVKKAE
jgi:hypothetical protein